MFCNREQLKAVFSLVPSGFQKKRSLSVEHDPPYTLQTIRKHTSSAIVFFFPNTLVSFCLFVFVLLPQLCYNQLWSNHSLIRLLVCCCCCCLSFFYPHMLDIDGIHIENVVFFSTTVFVLNGIQGCSFFDIKLFKHCLENLVNSGEPFFFSSIPGTDVFYRCSF